MKWIIYGVSAFILLLLTCLGTMVFVQSERVSELENLLQQSSKAKSALLQDRQDIYENMLVVRSELEDQLYENDDLRKDLREEKDNFNDLNDQVADALGTVGVLQKLKELDEELLRKYSRVSFLNENYSPQSLKIIDPDYAYNKNRDYQIKSEVEPFLDDMLDDASDDGMDLKIVSAYRSFGTQAAIKSNYVVIYGETAANQFSADQGFSEHQLGTTIDFTTTAIGSSLSQFKDTDEYAWLVDNAHKYGFILSYPEGNSFYVSEPWHWRFVGTDLARDMERSGQKFYDLDQREIDEYLVDIFED